MLGPGLFDMPDAYRNHLGVDACLSLFAGLAVMIAALGSDILGDGLRDLPDPRE